MINRYDFHTFKTEKGFFVSIRQEEVIREDFGPFHNQRTANQAAYKEWRRQQEVLK
jgi:hypothetical protein